MPYTIETHTHRLSAWAASTAARASGKCRFNVESGIAVLEASGFGADFTINSLPRPEAIDRAHRKWRKSVICNAEKKGLNFTHGVAAKLINTYLKVRFVCGGHHADPCVCALHPPIDRILLDNLAKIDFGGQGPQWRWLRDQAWSIYDSKTYEKCIKLIRETLAPGEPLWKIEEYWPGHRRVPKMKETLPSKNT